jgi:flagellar motor switch protein FliG
MDKLREYLTRDLQRLDYQLENYNHSDTPEHRSFLEGKSEALVDIVNLLDQPSLPPEGGSMEQKLRELVDAQEKYIERQDSLIEMQDKFIVTLIKEREGK